MTSYSISLQFQEVKLYTRDGFSEYGGDIISGDEYRTRVSQKAGVHF